MRLAQLRAYGNRVGCGPAVLNVAHDPSRARRARNARSFATDHGDHRPSAQPVPLGAMLKRRPDGGERENLQIVLIGYVNGTVTKGGGVQKSDHFAYRRTPLKYGTLRYGETGRRRGERAFNAEATSERERRKGGGGIHQFRAANVTWMSICCSLAHHSPRQFFDSDLLNCRLFPQQTRVHVQLGGCQAASPQFQKGFISTS